MSEAPILQRIRRHPLVEHIDRRPDGRQVHAVGGIVRDALLGRESTDLDLSVAGNGKQLAQQIADASGGTLITLGGDRFSSYRVVTGVVQADIWDRGGKSLASDLERRDLTINSLACALGTGGDSVPLEDPFGGLEDLDSRTLRATKEDCFERDPLRVLRLARFQVSLEGFTIDPATAKAAREASTGLERTASERIRDELQRILESPSTARALGTLRDLDALQTLVTATISAPAARALIDRARRLDRFLATLEDRRAGNADGASRGWKGDQRRLAALALLAVTAGHGDPTAGAAALAASGLATRGVLATARQLCAENLPTTEPRRRLFLDRHRHDWPLALAVSAAVLAEDAVGRLRARQVVAAAAALEKTAQANPGLLEGLPPLLDGHQAARILGVSPGPALGEALRALGQAQALGQVASLAQAEDFLRERSPKPDKQRGVEAESTSPKTADAD